MTGKNTSVSVIIPTKDRPLDLEDCVLSVLAQTKAADEVLIVDGSAKETASLDREFGEKVRYLFFPQSKGLTNSRNFGIKNAKGGIVIFLDDDIVLEPDFIERILDVFMENNYARIGGVCGNISNQKHQSEKGMYYWIRKIFLIGMSGDGCFRISGQPTFVYGTDYVKQVEFLPGGLTAYKREIFDEYLFDEKLTGYCYAEDTDFSYRVSRKYKNYYTPYARAFHKVTTESRSGGIFRLYGCLANIWYLNNKNMGLKGAVMASIVIAGMILEAVNIKVKSYFRR